MTRVELTDDLKNAKAFISVLPQEHAKLTMHGLVSATGKLRREVMDRIHIKEMPTLKFVYDEGHKAQMEVMALLEQDRRERGQTETGTRDPDSESPSETSGEHGA